MTSTVRLMAVPLAKTRTNTLHGDSGDSLVSLRFNLNQFSLFSRSISLFIYKFDTYSLGWKDIIFGSLFTKCNSKSNRILANIFST